MLSGLRIDRRTPLLLEGAVPARHLGWMNEKAPSETHELQRGRKRTRRDAHRHQPPDTIAREHLRPTAVSAAAAAPGVDRRRRAAVPDRSRQDRYVRCRHCGTIAVGRTTAAARY